MLKILMPSSLATLGLLFAFSFAACDSAEEKTSNEADVAESESDDSLEGGEASEDVAGNDGADDAKDQTADEGPAYPPGPYGSAYNDTIPNLSFYEPWEDREIALSDYYASEETAVILIVSAAGWCPACQYEAWDLVETYSKWHEYGFEVLYTLFEDSRGTPFFREGANEAAWERDRNYLESWKTNLGVPIQLERREANYPFLADPAFVLQDFYNADATPLTMIVRTSDMKILYRQVGYAEGSIDLLVKTEILKAIQ